MNCDQSAVVKPFKLLPPILQFFRDPSYSASTDRPGVHTVSSGGLDSQSNASNSSLSPLLTWRRFTPTECDFLLIDTNSSTPLRHLRTEKVNLWSRLIPAVSEHFRSGKPSANIAPPETELTSTMFGNPTTIFALIAVITLQMALLIIISLFFVRSRQRYRALVSNGTRSLSTVQ